MKTSVRQKILLSCLCFFTAGMVFSKLYVMPEQYAYVLARDYSGYSSEDAIRWGEVSKWNRIVLWGRCEADKPGQPNPYIGKYYRWNYGDGRKQSWVPITTDNYDYLVSEVVQYDMEQNHPSFVKFVNARLEISSTGVGDGEEHLDIYVKIINFGKIRDIDTVQQIQVKREILESIAKGRGLTYLYRNQKSDGSWDINLQNAGWGNDPEEEGVTPPKGTPLVLCAFLVYGHSVYDPNGRSDIFVRSINRGIIHLLQRVKTRSDSLEESAQNRINADGRMYGFPNQYRHGILMLAFAASYNDARKDQRIQEIYSLFPANITYRQFIEDLVEYTSWAQLDADKGPYEGGWRYAPNFTSGDGYHSDLSASQWPVLGLAAIEDIWGIRANNHVKNRLVGYVRRCQYSDGAALYASTPVAISAAGIPTTAQSQWLVGTSALLQAMYYLSLDTTTASFICNNNPFFMCSEPRCTNPQTDFKLWESTTTGTYPGCGRVKKAIDFIGRIWQGIPIYSPWSGSPACPSYYTLYVIMKALRLYGIEKGKINNGILYTGPNASNFTSPKVGNPVQWEDVLIDFVLKDMKISTVSSTNNLAYWLTDFEGNNPPYVLGTSLALLCLSEKVYRVPGVIRTEKEKLKFYEIGKKD